MSATNAGWAAAGSLVDQVVPDPPTRWHPTAWFGSAMTRVEQALYADRRTNGAAHAAIGLGIGVGAGLVLQRAIGRGPATAVATLLATGGSLLERAALDIAAALAEDDLARARDSSPGSSDETRPASTRARSRGRRSRASPRTRSTR